MSTNCSEFSSGCIIRRISKAPASAWRQCNASFTNMVAGYGRREKLTRAQPFFSPSARQNKRKRKRVEQRLEANHERGATGHIVGGGQSGRYGACPACPGTGQGGQSHHRCARWRGSSRLSFLSRRFRRSIVR